MTTVAAINRGTSRNPFLMACLWGLFWLSAQFNFHITARFIPGVSNTVPDDISRVHEPGRLSKLCPYVYPTPLGFHMSQASLSFSLIDPVARQRFTYSLDQEVSTLRALTFSESTRRTYQSQQMLYLQFCASLNIDPVPIVLCNLGRYIAFLGAKLCYSSVKQYLNIVRIMHLENGFSNPLSNNWYLSSILKGLRRHKGDGISQKLPITVSILQGILTVLNFNRPFDISFWAACLVALFSFFHKSNLLIPSTLQFDPKKHLCVSDVVFKPTGAVLSVRWSKTIQYRQKVLHIPLPRISDSPFCPTAALLLCITALPQRSTPTPLFSYPSASGIQTLTYISVMTHLRLCLRKLGLNPSLYSWH